MSDSYRIYFRASRAEQSSDRRKNDGGERSIDEIFASATYRTCRQLVTATLLRRSLASGRRKKPPRDEEAHEISFIDRLSSRNGKRFGGMKADTKADRKKYPHECGYFCPTSSLKLLQNAENSLETRSMIQTAGNPCFGKGKSTLSSFPLLLTK